LDGEKSKGWRTSIPILKIEIRILGMNLIRLFLFTFFVCISCSKNKNPESIPSGATYNKKTNSFSLIISGKKKVWNEKGQLFSETSLDSKNRENGQSLTFFPETGAILSKGNFVEGKREGIWEWYYPNGNIYYRSGYSPDKKREVWISTNLLGNEHGIHERYYENGQLEEKGSYEFGLKVDKWEKYYKNGKLEHFGSYQSDKKIGQWIYLYPDGKKVAEETFDSNGKLESRETFYPDGSRECSFFQNKLDCIAIR
jgi:antitoxin component YwqK of YwqJK toxin-antitoxin module